jgi:hypothetical protein
MNTIKASMVVMSHLSDAQELLAIGIHTEQANLHINFAKYIILKTKSDLNQEINADEMRSEERRVGKEC